jgi:hypothetical protein
LCTKLALFTRNHLLNNTVSYPRRKELVTIVFISIMSPFHCAIILVLQTGEVWTPSKYYIFSFHLTINSVSIRATSTSMPVIMRIVKHCCLHSQIAWQIDMLGTHSVTVTDRHHSNMIFVWTMHKTKVLKVDSRLVLTCPVHCVFVRVLWVLASCSVCSGSSCRSSPSHHCKAHATKYDSQIQVNHCCV